MMNTGARVSPVVAFHDTFSRGAICLIPTAVTYTPTMTVPTLASTMNSSAMTPTTGPPRSVRYFVGSPALFGTANADHKPMIDTRPTGSPSPNTTGHCAVFALGHRRTIPPAYGHQDSTDATMTSKPSEMSRNLSPEAYAGTAEVIAPKPTRLTSSTRMTMPRTRTPMAIQGPVSRTVSGPPRSSHQTTTTASAPKAEIRTGRAPSPTMPRVIRISAAALPRKTRSRQFQPMTVV